MRRSLFLTALVVAALLALLVSAMNPGRIDLELAFGRFAAPLGIALVVAFTIGLLAGLAWRVYWVAELLSERGRLRRALRLTESRERSAAAANERTS